MPHKGRHSAFTLIELLVVIAILAILAVVVVLVLNPAELLKQSRDANRLSDMQTLNSALGFYTTDQTGASSFSLGSSSVLYVSVPDPMATSSLGDQCQGLGLPALPTGWTYQCAASSTLHATNGTGWIPVDLKAISAGSPVGSLPVDPANTTSTGQYYAYATDGTKYAVTSELESGKNKMIYAKNPQTQFFPEIITEGTPGISPLFNPSALVGYWPLDETTGTTFSDGSGNNDNGTLVNAVWTSGKVAGGMNLLGSYTGSATASDSALLDISGSWTVSAWFNISQPIPNSSWYGLVERDVTGAGSYNRNYGILIDNSNGSVDFYALFDASSYEPAATYSLTPSVGTWYFVAGTWDSSAGILSLYLDGSLVATVNTGAYAPVAGSGSVIFGKDDSQGTIDDVRIYSRALSPAEVMALYNSER